MRLAAVILTMGNRPAELAELIRTVAKQQGDPIDVVVVGNGVKASALPDLGGARTVDLPENLGIPAGRNEGYRLLLDLPPQQRPEVILTLDDDGSLNGDQVAEQLRAAFAADPRLGIVSFRITDPATGAVQRRHVPRVRVGDPNRSSTVTTFLGGANAVRTAVLEQVGLLPGEFFLFHEETDLAWRALDAGWSIEYRADLTLHHPTTSPTRHMTYHRMVARNRVWLAKRNLPWLLVPVYLAVWAGLTVLRTRDPAALRAWLGGFAEGLRTSAGPRRPMRWRTVWRMARLGRPPII
ncbi:glycosyltransferase family 2 protein [Actinocrinis puniceicyclus]|uniref:Glycosyltransferase family 2 protein n=1 Tax=Actinocrinis puniceicyclus TaxID=977794 RepID=A0A8J7WKJ4_9ACTN|nr:glycosyltransferase [Actinocrinis puniceicyclus]MBS2962570.1 glycosyltransferase family 2 protein [Actinocrinis puniceicyclus]